MVLKRFFSPTLPVPTFLEAEETKGLDRGVTVDRDVLGVDGTFRAPVGLVMLCRVEVKEVTVVRRAGVAAVDLRVDVRSALVDDASETRLGFAAIPPLLFSSPDGLSSTELTDGLF